MARTLTLAMIVGLTCAGAVGAATPRYAIVALSGLSVASGTDAYAVNANGDVGGSSFDPATLTTTAVVWRAGTPVAIASSPIPVGVIRGINNDGLAVGEVGTVDGPVLGGAAFAVKGDEIHYYALPPSPDAFYPTAVNNGGVVVGAGLGGAAMDVDGQIVTLPGIDNPASTAYGVNDAGRVVGTITVKPNLAEVRGFVWDAGTVTMIGSFGGNWDRPTDINQAGVVVGSSEYADRRTGAFVWDGGVMNELPVPDGVRQSGASAINDAGQIVGTIGIFGLGDRAALWEDGRYTDLNDLIPQNSGWELTSARDINDRGMIAGTGNIGSRQSGFLLIPLDIADVPEPGGAAALAFAVVNLVGRRQRRRFVTP